MISYFENVFRPDALETAVIELGLGQQLEGAGDSECGENSNSQMTFPEFSLPPSPLEPTFGNNDFINKYC